LKEKVGFLENQLQESDRRQKLDELTELLNKANIENKLIRKKTRNRELKKNNHTLGNEDLEKFNKQPVFKSVVRNRLEIKKLLQKTDLSKLVISVQETPFMSEETPFMPEEKPFKPEEKPIVTQRKPCMPEEKDEKPLMTKDKDYRQNEDLQSILRRKMSHNGSNNEKNNISESLNSLKNRLANFLNSYNNRKKKT